MPLGPVPAVVLPHVHIPPKQSNRFAHTHEGPSTIELHSKLVSDAISPTAEWEYWREKDAIHTPALDGVLMVLQIGVPLEEVPNLRGRDLGPVPRVRHLRPQHSVDTGGMGVWRGWAQTQKSELLGGVSVSDSET